MSRTYSGTYIQAELRPDDNTYSLLNDYSSVIKNESGFKIIFKVPLNTFNNVSNWLISVTKNYISLGDFTPAWETDGEYKVWTLSKDWGTANDAPYHVYFYAPGGPSNDPSTTEAFYINFDNYIDYVEPDITYSLVKFDEGLSNTINIKIEGTIQNPFNNQTNTFSELTLSIYDSQNSYEYDVLQENWYTQTNDTFVIEAQIPNPSSSKSLGWRIEGKDVVGAALNQYMLYHNDSVLSGNPIFRIAGARRNIGVYGHLYTTKRTIWDEDNRYNAELGSYGNIFVQDRLINMCEFEGSSSWSDGEIGSSTYPFGAIYGKNIYQDGQKLLSAYSLYSNTSGSATEITLSDSTANYDYIEIFYGWETGAYGYTSCKIENPNGKIANLTCHALNNSRLYIGSSEWAINNNKITPSINEHWRLNTNAYPTRSQTAVVRIYKVVGYK